MSNSKHTCQIFHFDLYGTRQQKYEFLQNNNLHSVEWQELKPQDPNLFFVPKDISLKEEYEKGFDIRALLPHNTSGIKTHHDKDLVSVRPFNTEYNQPYLYRPLDNCYINYDLSKVVRHRYEKIHHLLNNDNIALIIGPQGQAVGTMQWNLVFVSDKIVDTNVYYRGGGIVFPLYLYPKEGSIDTERVPNLDEGIVRRIMEATASPQLQGRHQQHLRDADDSPQLQGRRQEHLRDADASRIYFDKTDFKYLHWATKLPHWHQDGKYVFVTFRLADSLPQAKLKELKEEKEIWLKNHPKPWSDKIEKEYYTKFASKADKWLDNNYGECLLKQPQNRQIVEDALTFFDGERYNLIAFVVMPNHVHLLMQMKEGANLESVMYSIKSFTAKKINETMNRSGSFWQSEYFDRIIRSEEHYRHTLNYIIANNRELARVKDGEGFISVYGDAGNSTTVCGDASNFTTVENSTIVDNSTTVCGDADCSMDADCSIHIFDYIYGVLHSPAYRTKYKEFLKIDFPRIPYPKNAAEFEHFRRYGQQLRELHLMRTVPESPVTFPEAGSMVVERVAYKDGRVQINGSQYFAGVPTQAWEFYIGGYQPAQKWLKDRKGRTLSFEDIAHYRNIIPVLIEAARIMEKIDA